MSFKTTGVMGLLLLVPIIVIIVIVIASIKCAECCETRGVDCEDCNMDLWTRLRWWRCFGSRSREVSERSGSSSVSSMEDSRDVETGGDRLKIGQHWFRLDASSPWQFLCITRR